jgi:hypothetical protein
MGSYAGYNGNYRRFGTTYRFHLQGLFLVIKRLMYRLMFFYNVVKVKVKGTP